ncbi:uncharacterized protein LOC143553903 [Bidens hawaiensis]|uniref:uncharacterized protein LOC143553903 n=1 Tax=Bidens hawaiensis TaxID=980011 RepID=UPI00404B7B9E
MAGDKEAGSLGTMKESIGGFVLQAPKLTSTNYASWSVMVKIILGANGLHDAIDKEKGAGIEERKKFMALGVIVQILPEDVMLHMAKYSEPEDVWEALRVRYLGAERTQKARVQMLRTEFNGLKMGDTESIDDFAAKLCGVQSKYKSLGAVLEEEVLVRKFLNSMPDKYLPVVSSMELLANIETMAFEDVVGRLKAYKERNNFKNVNGSSSQSQLMFTQTKKKVENYQGRGRYNGKGRGNQRWNGERKNDERGEYRKKNPREWEDRRKYVTCYNCDKIGHYSNECKEPSKGNDEVNLTKKEDDVDPSLLMAVCSIKKVSLNEERVIPVCLKRMKRMKLKTNLLSLRKLDEEGCNIEIANGTFRIYDKKERLLMKVQRNLNKTYNIKLQVCCNPNNFEDEKSESYNVKPIMKVKDIRFGTIPNDLFRVRESNGQERIDEKKRVENENSNMVSKLITEGTDAKFEESVKQICYSQLKRRNKCKKKYNSRLRG